MVIFKITAAFLFASVKSGGVITIDEDSGMLLKQEAEFARKHKHDTDEELFNYLKEQKKKFGKQLSPITTIGYRYIVKRFGSWAYIMGQINKKLKEENNERIELR